MNRALDIKNWGDGGNNYVFEIEAMKQEISSNDIFTALSTEGHIALYINFETGKSDIKPESQIIIDQIVEMLKSNSTLKISIEGHTDNVGNSQSNQPSKHFSVVRNPKLKFCSPSNDRTFIAKSLTAHRTLQHIYKAYKANLAKELQ